MNTDYLKEFERMNETTESVFDLGEFGLLVILNDGTNLTSWDDVGDFEEVLYISEDLSRQESYSRYNYCKNVKVIVMQNYTDSSQLGRDSLKFAFESDSLMAFYAMNWDTSRETSMNDWFNQCYSLEYVYLENWDTSGVKSFWGMFADCCNLKTLEGIKDWDLSSAENMESMFESCISLEDISPLSDWDMSSLENIFEMFRDCYSLKDASCLNWKFANLKNGDNLFINCHGLKKYPEWYDDEFINSFGIRGELEDMDDESIRDKIVNNEFDEQDMFVAVSHIEDENILKELLGDKSLHYYVKRAVLLNPNFKEWKILEAFALCSHQDVERAFAIENPCFKNIGLLRNIAKNDESYLVRFKAQRKIDELEKIIDYEDFAQEFKEAFENNNPMKPYLILWDWTIYCSDDANLKLAWIILGFVNDMKFENACEDYLRAMREEPVNASLFDWFNTTALNEMEKMEDADSEFFENLKNKPDNVSNNYAIEFFNLFEDAYNNSDASNLGKMHDIFEEWIENYPKDANVYCAYVILNTNRPVCDLVDIVKKAKYFTPCDENAYPKLLEVVDFFMSDSINEI